MPPPVKKKRPQIAAFMFPAYGAGPPDALGHTHPARIDRVATTGRRGLPITLIVGVVGAGVGFLLLREGSRDPGRVINPGIPTEV